jgi:formamidopyrimidine-DNA glycosylase
MVKARLPKFLRSVVKSRIVGVHRRAKLLLIDLSSGMTVVIHLKMSGQLIWQPRSGRSVIGGHPIPRGTENLPNAYTHITFVTSRGLLFFNDQRQFGFVKIVQTSSLKSWFDDQGYGPEPLSDDFTFEAFNVLFRRHQAKRVKPTLLDQRVIAGIGNIYADEACHFARVRPGRRIRSLKLKERRALYHGIRHVLTLSLRHSGTTAEHYRTSDGREGNMIRFLRVYGRTGLPCRRCSGLIKKIVLAQRGTHYCPGCQR